MDRLGRCLVTGVKISKEWRRLVEYAEAAGWVVTRTGGDHIRFKGPHGGLVFGASTPSDAKRSLKNTEALLRRHGLHLPTRKKRAS